METEEVIHFISSVSPLKIMNCYQLALKILSIKDYTSKQLRKKLIEKGFDQDDIENTIFDLSQNKYINDERYKESYLRYSIRKNLGFQKIKFQLQERGIIVSESDYQKQCDELKTDEEFQITQILEKKLIQFPQTYPEKQKTKARMFRFLTSRGYSSEKSLSCLDRVLNL